METSLNGWNLSPPFNFSNTFQIRFQAISCHSIYTTLIAPPEIFLPKYSSLKRQKCDFFVNMYTNFDLSKVVLDITIYIDIFIILYDFK